jgi:hypothetical protein
MLEPTVTLGPGVVAALPAVSVRATAELEEKLSVIDDVTEPVRASVPLVVVASAGAAIPTVAIPTAAATTTLASAAHTLVCDLMCPPRRGYPRHRIS